MSACPVCRTPGAYVGFTTVECRNPDCVHFTIMEEKICPCCGRVGHIPGTPIEGSDAEIELLDPTQSDGSQQQSGDPNDPGFSCA